MIPDTLRIGELLLRLPGIDEPTARQIAEDVAARLARALGRDEMFPVPAGSSLRVQIPAGVPRADLAETIAGRILEIMR